MNNRDMPSKGYTVNHVTDNGKFEAIEEYSGLSKLEYAAIAAMQGILARGAEDMVMTLELTTEYSVDLANALFDELEREKE